MNKQCEICERTGCIGKQSADKVCERCIHDTRKNWLKLCIDCAKICQFADKTQVRTVKDYCELCGSVSNLEVHHLMRGSSREMADKYGYKLCVCHACHTAIHHDGDLEMQLRRKAEQAHVDQYGEQDLIQKFGKSHL